MWAKRKPHLSAFPLTPDAYLPNISGHLAGVGALLQGRPTRGFGTAALPFGTVVYGGTYLGPERLDSHD